MQGGQHPKAVEMAKAIFAKFDADHSGTIDKEEAKNIFIEELKKSGETKLNFDQAVFEAWFEKADANHDG